MDTKIIRRDSAKHNHPDEIEEIKKIRTLSKLKEKIKKSEHSLDFNIKRNNRESSWIIQIKILVILIVYILLYLGKKNKNLPDDFNSFNEIPEEHEFLKS